MGLMQRRKGRAFEQRIVREIGATFPCREIGIGDAATVHRSSQADRAYHPDVVIDGNAPDLARRLWLECHDAREPAPLDKLAQAERDCRRAAMWRIPVVVWHRYRERRVQATLRFDALMVLTGAPFQPSEFTGIPVTCDWEQFLDVLRKLPVASAVPAKEAA